MCKGYFLKNISLFMERVGETESIIRATYKMRENNWSTSILNLGSLQPQTVKVYDCMPH